MNLTVIIISLILATTVIIISYIMNKCKHNYVQTSTHQVWSNESDKLPTQCKFIYHCSKCGNCKIQRL